MAPRTQIALGPTEKGKAVLSPARPTGRGSGVGREQQGQDQEATGPHSAERSAESKENSNQTLMGPLNPVLRVPPHTGLAHSFHLGFRVRRLPCLGVIKASTSRSTTAGSRSRHGQDPAKAHRHQLLWASFLSTDETSTHHRQVCWGGRKCAYGPSPFTNPEVRGQSELGSLRRPTSAA